MVVVPAELVRNLELERIRDDTLTNIKITSSQMKELVDKIKKQEAANILLKEIGLTNKSTPALTGYTLPFSSFSQLTQQKTEPNTTTTTTTSTTPKEVDVDTILPSVPPVEKTIDRSLYDSSQVSSSPAHLDRDQLVTSSFGPSPATDSPIIRPTISTREQVFNELKNKYIEDGFIKNPDRPDHKVKINTGLLKEYLFVTRSKNPPKGAHELAKWIVNNEKGIDLSIFGKSFLNILKIHQMSPIKLRERGERGGHSRRQQKGKGQRKNLLSGPKKHPVKGLRRWIKIL